MILMLYRTLITVQINFTRIPHIRLEFQFLNIIGLVDPNES